MIKFLILGLDLGRGFLMARIFQLMWLWTIVPLGMKPVGYWHAYLLGSFCSYVLFFATAQRTNVDLDSAASTEAKITWSIIKTITAAICLLVYWIIHTLTGPY